MTREPVLRKKPRRRSRHAKTTLLAFGVVFLAATVAASFALDAALRIRFPYLASLAEAYSRQTEPVVLSLGSSRTSQNLDPGLATAILQDRGLASFNASVHGSALTTQEAVLGELLRKGPMPAMVTLEVNPEFLHRRLLWVHMSRDVTWSNLFEVAMDLGSRRAGRLAETRVLPLYARRNEIRRAICKAFNKRIGRSNAAFESGLETPSPVGDTGPYSAPPMPVMTESLKETQQRLAAAPIAGYSPTGSAVRSLERMLAACQQRGIPVLLIDAPICTRSREGLASSDREYRAFLAGILERFPNARHYDAQAALPDVAFIDQHHANDYGRHVFSERLAREVFPAALEEWNKGGLAAGVRHRMANSNRSETVQ